MLVSVLAIYWDDDAPTSALRAADNKHTHEHTRARTHTPNNMYVYNASSVGVSTLYRPQPPHRTGHSTTSKRRYHTCTTCVSWSYIGGTKYMVFQADGYKTNCMWWCSCNYLAHVNYMNTTTCSLLQKNWSSSLHHQSLSCRPYSTHKSSATPVCVLIVIAYMLKMHIAVVSPRLQTMCSLH